MFNKKVIGDIVAKCNQMITDIVKIGYTKNMSLLSIQDIENIIINQSKPKLKIKKPSKKQKLKIKTRSLNTKLKINSYNVVKNYPHVDEFTNDYVYFSEICKIEKINYHKYKTTCWSGPAVISDKSTVYKLKSLLSIQVLIDILPFNRYAIYPEKLCDDESITYKYDYQKKETTDIFELIEWTYKNIIFYLDTKTDKIYTYDDKLFVGKRIYRDSWDIICE